MNIHVIMDKNYTKIAPVIATTNEARAKELVNQQRKGNWMNRNKFAWSDEVLIDDKEALVEIIKTRGEEFVRGILQEQKAKRDEYRY